MFSKTREGDPFFTTDKTFYTTLFRMLFFVAFQNIIAYSVNMADNIMLGRYSQEALSGAATVNQIFFMVQQFVLSIVNTLVALASQYWGKGEEKPIRVLTGISLKLGTFIGIGFLILCGFFPYPVLRIFTNSQEIIAQGRLYLPIIMWSFLFFILTSILMGALRAVGIVRISFVVSAISLVINVCINYVLIFGKFGFPEMGIRGAAIGTLIARVAEIIIVIGFLVRDKRLKLLQRDTFAINAALRRDFKKTYIPMMLAQVLWGVSVPVQTSILGHLSADAIAANSVATTFYQYLKVIVQAMAATSSVLIGNTIGRADMKRIKSDAHSLTAIDLIIGVILGLALIMLRKPLLSLYNLNAAATQLSLDLIVLMGVVMMTMSYQMPVSFGIMQGAGDVQFTMRMNIISVWGIVIPLSLAAAFWWKLPVVWVVLCIQSDQIFKCIPTFIHFRKFTWIKKLTR